MLKRENPFAHPSIFGIPDETEKSCWLLRIIVAGSERVIVEGAEEEGTQLQIRQSNRSEDAGIHSREDWNHGVVRAVDEATIMVAAEQRRATDVPKIWLRGLNEE
jgi:hypothetical protein